MLHFFHKIFSQTGWFLDLIYPHICVLCKNSLAEGEKNLCASCLSDLPRSHILNPVDNPVARLFWGKFPFIFAVSFLVFEKGNVSQQIIHQIKYYENQDLAVMMGTLLGSFLQSFKNFQDIDFIIPVPLHKRKQRIRGFNQSERIAEGISSLTNKPVMSDLLIRDIYSPTQTRKNRYERWENVSGIFRINDSSLTSGKHILLVDDVITTGATMEACVNALINISGIRISLASLAYAL